FSLSSPFLKNSLSSPSLKNSAKASLSLSQSKQTHLPLSPSSPSLIPELQLRRRRHKFNIRHTVSDCLNLSRSRFWQQFSLCPFPHFFPLSLLLLPFLVVVAVIA
ncbi:hypothetical protein CFOL_v3_02532, partial [Cephalotus follicularis]